MTEGLSVRVTWRLKREHCERFTAAKQIVGPWPGYFEQIGWPNVIGRCVPRDKTADSSATYALTYNTSCSPAPSMLHWVTAKRFVMSAVEWIGSWSLSDRFCFRWIIHTGFLVKGMHLFEHRCCKCVDHYFTVCTCIMQINVTEIT